MNWGRLRIVLPIALVSILLLIYFSPELAALLYEVVAYLTPLWLPLLLIRIAWPLWLRFARAQYVFNIEYATLELKPGAETPKTAKAMELALYSLYHRTEISKKDYLLGHVRPWWSLEIYLHDSKTRFFAHIPKNHVAAFTARLESEYRDMEIDPVRDYSREIPFDASSMRAHVREFALTKPDPYPLRTYESYEGRGEDRLLRALAPAIDIGSQEHLLISFIIRPHQRERTSYFREPSDPLQQEAHQVIAKLIGTHGDLRAIPQQKQVLVAAIEKALSKPSFDCGIRALYIAGTSSFDAAYAAGIDTLFDEFGDTDLNSFVAYDPLDHEGVVKKEAFALSPHLKANHLVELYRRRSFFAPPYIGRAFVLNTEELATVFHMPYPGRGGVIGNRSHVELEPPHNLPV